LRKARDIIGLPVISIATGKRVGTVKDLMMDAGWNLQAIVLDAKNWFSNRRCISADDVIGIGEDAVTIGDESVIQEADVEEGYHFLTDGPGKIQGLPVITVNGQQLGFIEDVYLDQKMGKKIVGYELSEGFISDLKEGRKRLPVPVQVTMGEDALIVPVYCDKEMEDIFVSNEG
jgi:uncharacterized protein YrrD